MIQCNMFDASSVIVDIKYGMVLALSKFKAITSETTDLDRKQSL